MQKLRRKPKPTITLPTRAFIVHTCSNAAREYVELEFGDEPFVADHVRPFPDTCLNAWAKEGEVPIERPEDPCYSNGGLLLDLADSVEMVMSQHKVKRLFILAHPSIRHRIKSILSEVGVFFLE